MIETYNSIGIFLTEAGQDRWVGLCPFHSENTPSFFVFGDGSYHCFGCQAHGTINDFFKNNDDKIRLPTRIDDIIEHTCFELDTIRDRLETDLLLSLEDCDYETKNSCWRAFDAIFEEIVFEEDLSVVDAMLRIKHAFYVILKSIKRS